MPAFHAPFPNVSLRGGRSALQIGRALGPFTSGQAGRGTVPTHSPSVIPPPINAQPPPPPPRSHPTSAWPSIAAWVEGSLTLSRADSPEPAHTVGALFQQQGPGGGVGGGPGQGEETNSADKLEVKVKAAERELPGPFVRFFPGI